MDRRDELEQQIWEFVYDLLPQDEAEALRQRIAAEPDVARLHADVRRKAAILAQAARLELPPIALAPPDASVGSPADPTRHWANWVVALAASLLLCYLGFAGFRTRTLERSLAGGPLETSWADQPLRTVVFGPTDLQPAVANYFAVQTQTAGGVPRAAAVDYRVLGDDGTLLTNGQVQSDASGFAQFNFRTSSPAENLDSPRFENLHLELESQTALPAVTVRRTLPVAARELTTYVSADKTIYRPGETLRCRSVTLDRTELRVVREVLVEFLVLDAAGQESKGTRREVLSQHGVAFAEFELPRFQPAGKHTLVARSPAGAFPEARREFEVRPYAAPTLRQRLDFARDSYGAGEEVEAELNVETAAGGAARGVPLAVIGEAGGRTFFNLHTTTDDRGAYRIRFRLPEEIATDSPVLSVTAGNEPKNRISEAIPVHRDEVHVEYFPESGELVEGMPNRVYFFAHDTRDKPIHIQGRLIDGQDRELATVETIHDGRGMFVFRPVRGETYRLEIDPASGSAGRFKLPPTSDQQFLLLDAAPGVFAAEAPLKVRLRTSASRPVAVSAVCRGVVVGQELVSPEVFQQESESGGPEILLSLADSAEGVIRLTAYDYSVDPPAPVAERLVFRRPGRKLSIRPDQDIGRHHPGESVQWVFSVQDERGRPLHAVLGAAVVDEAALSLARDRSASLTTHFWLTGQIDDVRGLEDANVYLAEGSQAEQALDLLLGTQGWRRFVGLSAGQLAQLSLAEQTAQPYFTDSNFGRVVLADEPAAPAVLVDNATEAAEAVRSGLASLQSAYALTVQRVGRVLVVASLILAAMLGLLAVTRRMPATAVWLPALGTSALCLLLGGAWLATAGKLPQEYAKVSAVHAAAEVQLAQVDESASRTGAAAPVAAPESAKADTAASERWDGIEKQLGKNSSLAREGPAKAESERAADSAGMPADKFARPQAAQEMEKRKDVDHESDDVQDPQRQAEPTGLMLQQRKMHEQAEPLDELSRDAPAPAESSDLLSDAAKPVAPDARRSRGVAPERAAGAASDSGKASRRLASSTPAAPPPGQAAGQPASAAASAPAANAKREQREAVLKDAVETKANEAVQGGLRKKAEQAPAAMPSPAGQVPSDAATLGARGGGMGGNRAMFGAGAPRPAARDNDLDRKSPAADAEESLSSAPESDMSSARPLAPAKSVAAGDALAQRADRSKMPAPQQMFRQYAAPNRFAARADDRGAPLETVCWEPLLLTDAQGRATLQFRLSDAATTYRVLVDGHAQGRIGTHLGRIVVQPEPAGEPQ